MKKKGQNKSFFILHGVMSKSITHIVICDLGTVLDLHLLDSFTYLENKRYFILVYSYDWTSMKDCIVAQ